ncbi:MAG: 3-dehydroquinate synthase [Chloroflexi bacterium]|nr:3-dehydroquinate synthase [Chloroflexota bacterium]
MAVILTVRSPDGDYQIVIERGVARRVAEFSAHPRVAVTTNTTIAPLHAQTVLDALPTARLVTMPDGEQYKTLATVEALYHGYVQAGLDRHGAVLALGGGVVGDTAGFGAATYYRGVDLIQMPTSLLAMVDSSVGGKVGVDLPEGKNLVGAFKQPTVVLIDTDFLATLPEVEWRCGMAEVVKAGLIGDPAILDPSLWTSTRAEDLIRRAVQVKIDIVEADPFEKGVRAYLNLGHTFAHALETVTHYGWRHGEAVGLGLVAAAHLSAGLGMCDTSLPEQVEAWVRQVGLPTRLGDVSADTLWDAMATDKKWRAGRSRFVLMHGPQHVTVVEDVPRSAVLEALDKVS